LEASLTISRRSAHVTCIATLLAAGSFSAASAALATPGVPRPLLTPRSGAGAALQSTVYQTQKEIQQHQEELGVLKSTVDALNTRIGDISNRIGDVNTWLAEFTVITALGGIVIGFLAYQTSALRARKTAEEWLASNAQDLLLKIRMFEEEQKRTLDETWKAAPEAQQPITAYPLEQETSPNTSAGWSELGFAAYTGEKLALAAEYFGNAAEAQGASDDEIAKALFNKGVTLGTLNHSNEEIAAYDALAARFENTTDSAIREQVAMALFGKGAALGKLNRPDEAIAAYDALIAHFENAEEASLRDQVAMALFSKGVALDKLNRTDEAIAAYDMLILRFNSATDPARVAKALYNKGSLLRRLKRLDEAIAVYESLIARFENSTEPAIRELLAKASTDKESTQNANKAL
jgi:tetratricopeptide (TPR) repeat protein